MIEPIVKVPLSQFQRLMKACSTQNQCGHWGNPDCECYRESSNKKKLESIKEEDEKQESVGC